MGPDFSGLHHQLEPRQFVNQIFGQVGSLTVEDDHIGIFEPHRQLPQALDRVGVNPSRVRLQARSAGQFTHCILVVIKNDDVHEFIRFFKSLFFIDILM